MGRVYFLSDPRLVERRDGKSPTFEYACPIPHPTRAEAALAVIKDDATTNSSYAAHGLAHSLRPCITEIGDPSARKAECGSPRSTAAISFPQRSSALPSKAACRTCQTLQGGCETRYSTQPPRGWAAYPQ